MELQNANERQWQEHRVEIHIKYHYTCCTLLLYRLASFHETYTRKILNGNPKFWGAPQTRFKPTFLRVGLYDGVGKTQAAYQI